MKCGEFVDELRICQLLKEDAALYPVLCCLSAVTQTVSTILSPTCKLSSLTVLLYVRCSALQIPTAKACLSAL